MAFMTTDPIAWFVIFCKIAQDQSKQGQPMKGTWDAIHVFEVEDKKKPCHYKLTSTVMLSIETQTEATGKVSLAGNLTRQQEADAPVSNPQSHIANIGRLVEDMEIKLRTTLDTIYFGKTKDIFNQMRSMMGSSVSRVRDAQMSAIAHAVKK
jgi:capping protein beta